MCWVSLLIKQSERRKYVCVQSDNLFVHHIYHDAQVSPLQYGYVHSNLHLLITTALITSTQHKQLDSNAGFENRWNKSA